MELQIKKAQRKQIKLKVGFSGAAGFGKTYSALLMAHGMTGDWSKIVVIDTENGSADLYSDLGGYSTLTLEAPYSPERYIQAIQMCEKAGFELIVIDSITHEWEGKGGCLEIMEQLGGKYQDWAKVTPRHRAFIDAILQSPCHVFTTVRRKQEYEMSKSENGRVTVTKTGTKEVTREGFEYELTLNFEFLNDKHLVKASKDRTGLFSERPEFVITKATGEELLKWSESGVDELAGAIHEVLSATTLEGLMVVYGNHSSLHKNPKFIEELKKQKQHLTPAMA